jgi:hypothetical protein
MISNIIVASDRAIRSGSRLPLDDCQDTVGGARGATIARQSTEDPRRGVLRVPLGESGCWRTVLDQEGIDLVKRFANRALVAGGYERDDRW